MVALISMAKYRFAESHVSNRVPYLCPRRSLCGGSDNEMLLECLFSVHVSSQGFRMAELRGGGTGRFPTLSADEGDTGHKGIQMRRGSFAKLAIQGNFGKLSTSPLRAGKTSLQGLRVAPG